MMQNPAIVYRQTPLMEARYHSGRLTLAEEFKHGRLCTKYWSSSGQILPWMYSETWFWDHSLPADSFVLAVNGQDLSGGWQWVKAGLEPDTSHWRTAGRNVCHGVTELHHAGQNITARIHTRLDGSPFLIRWLEIINKSAKPVGITALAPFAGVLWSHRVDEHLASPDDLPFQLAYNHLFDQLREGDFYFEPIPAGSKTIDGGRKGRSGWGRPAFWARNRCNGQTFVCEFAWSGNYAFTLDCRINPQTTGWSIGPLSRKAELFFRMGLTGFDPVLRVLEPNETVNSPAVHLALFQDDDDAIVQATHDHVRHVVMPAQIPDRHVEIEANHRGYLCDRETVPDIKNDIDLAAAIGAEMYVIDAGWYGNEPNQWWKNVGDWQAGKWLDGGLEPIVDHVHKSGMKFGLWVEIEAAGENSTLKKNHPDWLLSRDGKPITGGRALDLTNPAVLAFCESEITRLITRYHLDMYRIDHNHCLWPAGNRTLHGMTEDLTWRYYDNFLALFDRLRKKFPKVVFQNCAGGGGRLDWATLSRFHNTESSDFMRLPRGLKIHYGLTWALPPEIMLRTFGTEVPELELDGDIDAQLRMVCMSRPIFRGIAPSLDQLSPFLKQRVSHHLQLYRDFIRPTMINGRVFHHTSFLPLTEASPWTCLEYATPDASRSVIALFKTADSPETTYLLRPRGIHASKSYTVTLDNSAQTFHLAGADLLLHGLPIQLPRPMSSELILLHAN